VDSTKIENALHLRNRRRGVFDGIERKRMIKEEEDDEEDDDDDEGKNKASTAPKPMK
jgi:hypothetical protein